jgi:hypothetical protein
MSPLGPLAQQAEQLTLNQPVTGSSPVRLRMNVKRRKNNDFSSFRATDFFQFISKMQLLEQLISGNYYLNPNRSVY